MRVNDHHDAGNRRRWRRPSARSSRVSVHNASAVATTATIIATIFSTVGDVVKRVSTAAVTETPSSAGPGRSVKMPTSWGRRSRSKVRSPDAAAEPVIAATVRSEFEDRVTEQSPDRSSTGAEASNVLREMTSNIAGPSSPATRTRAISP